MSCAVKQKKAYTGMPTELHPLQGYLFNILIGSSTKLAHWSVIIYHAILSNPISLLDSLHIRAQHARLGATLCCDCCCCFGWPSAAASPLPPFVGSFVFLDSGVLVMSPEGSSSLASCDDELLASWVSPAFSSSPSAP